MPNWCYNDMDVMGDRDELAKFIEATKFTNEDGKTEFGLNHLFPVPEEVNSHSGFFSDPEKQAEQEAKEKASLEKFGYKDWYDWACADENWGTKWGACRLEWKCLDENDQMFPTDQYISAYYETAWCPADGLIRNISAKFPNLIFSVVSTEESDAFVCYSIFRNGKTVAAEAKDIEYPQWLTDLYMSNEDEYFEKHNDWRCEYADEYHSKADRALSSVMAN